MQSVNPTPLATVPTWRLEDLFNGINDPALTDLLTKAEAAAIAFAARYKGTLATISAAELAAALSTYETLQEQMALAGSYAGLYHSTRLDNPEAGQFYQQISERLNDITRPLIFWTLEINAQSEDWLTDRLSHAGVARYRRWLQRVRQYKAHQLAEDLERLLHEKEVVGHSAWVRLYDEKLTDLRFRLEGKSQTLNEVLQNFYSKDATKRRAAGRAVGKVLQQNIRPLALVFNTIVKDKAIDDKWRHYPHPAAARHLDNDVDQTVVDALHQAVVASYPRLAHRYYALKAKWLGLPKLSYWDRNAPLPEAADETLPWSTAQTIVLDAFGAFSPVLRQHAARFFNEGWIDAVPRAGKESGAFAHPVVPSKHPYILLNYHGTRRDILTLAHELGHGVHQILAGEAQGYLQASTPLTLAETASVFGEMLVFKHMLHNASPTTKRALLAAKVEDKLNTVVRQIAFHRFEEAVHQTRQSRELTPDDFSKLWKKTQREALGSAVSIDKSASQAWAYISHFIHTPFYVYAYAFGDCFVNALYSAYLKQPAGFAERYLDLLKAGGTKRYDEIVAPFGLNPKDASFWNSGLNLIATMIDELEGLER